MPKFKTWWMIDSSILKRYADCRARSLPMIVLLFTISVAIIGIFTAPVTLQQYAAAATHDNAMHCIYHLSDTSKCQQKDIPFILPFP
jgi:hypothetical protein